MTTFDKDSCLADIERRILALELEPGAQLDETALARHYGMSRTPLREVLHRLAGAGFVLQAENRSAQVASMDIATMRIFFQTAPMIYAAVGRMAAENRTDGQLDALKAAQGDFCQSVAAKDPGAAALANHAFHSILGEMAGNPYLVAALNRLLIDHTRLSQTFYRPTSEGETALVEKAQDQHDLMIAAIAAREPATMVSLTLAHWDLSRDRVERFVRPDPLPVEFPDAV